MIRLASNEASEWVYPDDPALDQKSEAFDFDKYLRTGDRKHLAIRDGQEPLVFKVRRLDRKQFFRVMSRGSNADQVQDAVAFGLVGVSPEPFALLHADSDLGPRLADASLDKVYDLGAGVLLLLGAHIVNLSQAKSDPT